ncbi:M4 family metallopeptidase [Larkinella rosea]|uniref:T9SS C-terminal target domain-containing protein n=1 Tax=Larkinella rosea TaxID=2025312 RepID=A0A3P1BZ81_9BACT|nr:M4 family metallopeptidase [Larkinella rosea]RRB06445.1 T9SS C-terminal target domain-containing protein [Larkinella rosea]
MKSILSTLFLAYTVGALAQSPQSGFDRKLKTQAPTPGLAQKLNAEVGTASVRKGSPRMAAGVTSPQFDAQSLKLRIVRDTATNLPVYIENHSPVSANKGARMSARMSAFSFMNQIKGLLKIEKPEEQFEITTTETDQLGQTHIRMAQHFQGIPVYGSELVAHLTNGTVTLLNGQFRLAKNASTTPRLSLKEATDRAFQDVGKESIVRSFGQNIFNMKPSEGALCFYPEGEKMTLAYQLTIRPNMIERWQYMIDAQTGAVLNKYNHTCGVDGPVKASGKDLNGVMQTFQTYQSGSTYYLLDASRSMFDAKKSTIQKPVGAIVTYDARNKQNENGSFSIYDVTSKDNKTWTANAISAHGNAGLAYEYYEKTHKRTSLDGKGGTMVSIVNVLEDGEPMDNAYWSGEFMAYGNGNKSCKPLAGGLDVAGHEMTHGVIEKTANLIYQDQSGAINESMADVFGAMVDRDDWLIGDDIVLKTVFPTGAMRSFINPNQNGKGTRGYQPKTMAEFLVTKSDNGGVHGNSGITNYAFYLFATKIGKEKAEQVYYRTLTKYLTLKSQFLDLRLGVIRSATDLYGENSAETKAAKDAFDAVGIVETTPKPDEPKDVPANNGQDMILLYSIGDQKLYTAPLSTGNLTARIKAEVKHRPSITDDGKGAYYVTADGRIRAVTLTGAAQEVIISDEPIWDNVAISRDGTKIAALTKEKDKSIWVYSYDLKKWKQFPLSNPTTAEGISTGEVEYADSFEWDFAGEVLIYDAFNKLKSGDGADIEFWDVGILDAWNNDDKGFGSGQIIKLFKNLEEGESVGNPSFSRNSPNIIAFDYYNSIDDSYKVWIGDLKTGTLNTVLTNTTLSFPGYSRLDDRLIFNTLSANGDKELVASLELQADKKTSKGEVKSLYENAKWAVWYAAGTRVETGKTAQTITFNAIPDRYDGDGSFTLSATASSKLAVSFEIVSGSATLSGNRLTPTKPGVVTVRAIQAGNDQFAAAAPVERKFNVLAITGTEPTWSDALKLYPNPVSTSLTVELPMGEYLENLTLTTVSGATLIEQPVKNRTHQSTLDTSQLPSGFYVLKVQTPKGVVHRKVVKP